MFFALLRRQILSMHLCFVCTLSGWKGQTQEQRATAARCVVDGHMSSLCLIFMHLYMYVCMFTNIQITPLLFTCSVSLYVCLYLSIYVCIYLCMFVSIYVCLYLSVYVCMSTNTQFTPLLLRLLDIYLVRLYVYKYVNHTIMQVAGCYLLSVYACMCMHTHTHT